jgi:hypothetical protein
MKNQMSNRYDEDIPIFIANQRRIDLIQRTYDLYHLNLHHPSAQQESTEILERVGVAREWVDWFWEQLYSLDDNYQQEIGALQWRISELEDELEEARENCRKTNQTDEKLKPEERPLLTKEQYEARKDELIEKEVYGKLDRELLHEFGDEIEEEIAVPMLVKAIEAEINRDPEFRACLRSHGFANRLRMSRIATRSIRVSEVWTGCS